MHAIYIEQTFYSSFTNSSSSSVVYTRGFLYFTQVWVIKASSPTVGWSNGQAERFVQTLKRMLIKAQADRRDPYLAPSDYRNSPISDLLTLQHRCSWVDAFAARSQQPLCSCASVVVLIRLHSADNNAKNSSTTAAPSLCCLSKKGVGVWHKERNQRKKATVLRWCPEPRSYWIQTEHGTFAAIGNTCKSNRKTSTEYNRIFGDEEDVETSSPNSKQLLSPISAENSPMNLYGRRIHSTTPFSWLCNVIVRNNN